MSPRPFNVAVPATSANLGPGFDAVGIALGLPLRAHVRPSRRFSLAFRGAHAPTHGGYANAIRRAIVRGYGALPPVAIDVDNAIPLGKGLGSSAAAAVLGLAIAQRCKGERIERERLAQDAAALEGHADNVYAAVYGGTVIAASFSSVKLPAPHDMRAIVVVPDLVLSTSDARAMLPESYSRDDVAFTAARASLLGAALASRSWHALREAMRDRVHQPYRATCIPGLDRILAISERGLAGIALSGAGPSVLAIVTAEAAKRIGESIHTAFAQRNVASDVLHLRFSVRGAVVRGA